MRKIRVDSWIKRKQGEEIMAKEKKVTFSEEIDSSISGYAEHSLKSKKQTTKV